MTMTIDPPKARRSAPASASQQLRTRFAAVRVSFTWFGVRKSLSAQQKAQAAEAFDAEGQFLSAAKKLVDTRDERFAAVTRIRHRIVSYWRAMSLPYPEPGLRLIRQADIDSFDAQMQQFRDELAEAVVELDEHYDSLRAAARDRLGQLFNPADYPPSLRGLFEVAWEFPSVEPPPYLQQLNPQLFQQEQARMQARFEEAARLAEEAFTAEFAKLVGHLVERLGQEEDGTRKVFRDSAVENLKEFFDRFRHLNIHSSAELDRLVEQAQAAVAGVAPQAIRDNDGLRRQIGGQLSAMAATLDGLLVDQPRRRILRPARQEQA
jgi:hypothetical protein